ncbi:MAG: hypothetical protein JWM85_3570 [Acidimicrobiaceae bacterium]|nr:hypothetical protein [Acidimicrobiaceae bacterium]
MMMQAAEPGRESLVRRTSLTTRPLSDLRQIDASPNASICIASGRLRPSYV